MIAGTWRVVAVGLLSTLSMDVLTGIAAALKVVAPLPPGLVGRWFASVARAHPFHADIARASPVPHELIAAFPVHYAIGTALAAAFVYCTGALGWPRGVGVALAFGLSTSVLPWFIMFPAMGYGLFGTHGPEGTRLFVSSLITHAFFGLGLWMAVRVVKF
jgi:Protein of unknown function (DUF2938)